MPKTKIQIEDLKQLSKTKLAKMVIELSERISTLELLVAKLSKDSSNSSKPSSTDFHGSSGNSSHHRNSRNHSGKKTGGQPGHDGTTRKNVDKPDETVVCAPRFCTSCHGDLQNSFNWLSSETVGKAQVVDIPPIVPIITEYQKLSVRCACGHTNTGQFPAGVTSFGGIQLGSSISSFLVYMNIAQHLPYQRLQILVTDLLHLSVSQGTIENKLEEAGITANPIQESILAFLHSSQWVGSDETGTKVQGKRWWQWVWQNTQASYYAISPSRGYKVIQEYFGEAYHGSLIHDCLSAQNKTTAGHHQLCHAHLFRDCQFLIDTKGENTIWAHSLRQLLYKSQKARDKIWGDEFNQDIRLKVTKEYRRKLTELLTTELTGKESKKLQKRLIKHQDKILHFMTSPDIPPDNNGSERAIRNAKIKQKISGGFRSVAGATRHATILSVIETAKKQKLNVLDTIQRLMRGERVDLFVGAG